MAPTPQPRTALCLLLLLVALSIAQQANMFPCDAWQILEDPEVGDVTVAGNISNGAPFTSPLGGCRLYGASLWYTFTPDRNGTLRATTCFKDTKFTAQVTLLSSNYANCNSLTTCLGAKNETYGQCDPASGLTAAVVQGTQYWLAVSGVKGNFLLEVSIDEQNTCESPQAIHLDKYGMQWVSGSFQETLPSAVSESCGRPSGTLYHWYAVELEEHRPFLASTCNQRDGSPMEGVADVLFFSGTCTNLGCPPASAHTTCFNGGQGSWMSGVPTGGVYMIAVVSPSQNQTYDLQVGYSLPSPGCAKAIGPIPIERETRALMTAVETKGGPLTIYRSPWFSFEATFTGRVEIYATSTRYSVYGTSNPCNNLLAEPPIDDDDEYTLKEGQILHVQVYSDDDGDQDNVTLYYGEAQ